MKTAAKRGLAILLSVIIVIAILPQLTIKAKASSGVDDFVTRCYQVALGREPEPEGFADWTNKLNNGAIVGFVVAREFIFSEEYKAKNKTDDEFIKDLYQMFMGREPEPNGYEYWMEKISEGMGREEVFAGFSNSEEFINLCTGYGITAGYYSNGYPVEQINNVNLFVERLYKTTLNRIGDSTGQEYWVKGLLEKQLNGVQCAANFVKSDEYVNKGLSNEEYVDNLYAGIMGRTPDEGGRKYWLDALNNYTQTRDQVFEGFSKSEEFKGICEGYGIECGNYTATDIAKKRVKALYAYDSNGQLSSQINFDIFGNVTKEDYWTYEYEYNASNDVIKKTKYSNSTGMVEDIETYEYDEKGNLVKDTLENITWSYTDVSIYEYDANGNLMKIWNCDYSNPTPKLRKAFEYNSNGDLIRENDYDYAENLNDYYIFVYPADGKSVIKYSFYGDGREKDYNETKYLIDGTGIKYTRISNLNNISVGYEGYYYSGTEKKIVHIPLIYQDLFYNLEGIKYDTEIPKVLNDGNYSYEYDGNGRLIKENVLRNNGTCSAYIIYEYDESGYATKESYYWANGSLNWARSYRYDFY